MTFSDANLDSNGQPFDTNYNFARNKEKAIYGLKGILEGITADKELHELELLFLDIWLREQKYLKGDGDVIDLLDLIGEILADGVITQDELEELHSLSSDIIQYKKTDTAGNESKINELIGLLSGITADNRLDDEEIDLLINWLNSHPEIAEEWPTNLVVEQLSKALEDGIITDNERAHLLDVMKKITGIRFEESGIAYGMATDFFEDSVSSISHEDSTFCFTGTFVTGTRSVVQDMAKSKGSSIKKDVSGSVHYLVIGTLASRDWRFTSHGRKIEKALKLKKEGHAIEIINERTWLKYA